MRRRDATLAALAVLGTVTGTVAGTRAGGVPGPLADATPITLLDGRSITPADWQGKAAVLVFWATWCGYCERHNVHVEALYRATRGQPLFVLGVALDSDAELVRRTVARRAYSFPVAVDGGAWRARLTARRVTPMTLTFDRGGRLVESIPGEMSEADVLGLARVLQRPG